MLVYLMCALSCVIAYLVCGIPSAYIVTRRMAHIDVRDVGSGNVGSTNAVRAAGPKAGVLTLVLDILKAALSMLVGLVLIGFVGTGGGFAAVAPGGAFDWAAALVYLFCICGHVFTPYLHFKGGKGIAVGFGGAVVLMPLGGLALWLPFLLFAVTTRYVSLGSVVAALSLPVWAVVLYRPSVAFVCILCVVAAIVIFSHRSNIAKLVKGTERRFSFKKEDGSEKPGDAEGAKSAEGAEGSGRATR